MFMVEPESNFKFEDKYCNLISNIKEDLDRLRKLKTDLENKMINPAVEELLSQKTGKWLHYDIAQYRKIISITKDSGPDEMWCIKFKIIYFDDNDDTYINYEITSNSIYNLETAKRWLNCKSITDAELEEKVNTVYTNIRNKYLK